MNEFTILFVEDDESLSESMKFYLEAKGYQVILTRDGEEAKKIAITNPSIHLILLDVMLPIKDGFTLASELREMQINTPIIFLTAKSQQNDKIEGFRVGGDDYITKPFNLEELLARIHAVIQRSYPQQFSQSLVFELGDYTFDYPKQILTYKNEETIQLTAKEAELLKMLCINLNNIVSRDKILERIWGENSHFTSRSMDVFLSRIRKYLQKDQRIKINRIHKIGVKLVISN